MRQLIEYLQQKLHFRVCGVYLLESQFISDAHKFFSGVLTAMSAMVQLEVPHINILSKMDLIEGRPGELLASSRQSKQFIRQTSRRSDDYEDSDDEDRRQFDEFNVAENDPEAPQSGYANTWTEEEEEERDRRHQAIRLDRYLEADPFLLLDSNHSAESSSSATASSLAKRYRKLDEAIVRLIEDYNMVNFMPLNIHDEESLDRILLAVDIAIQYGEDEEPREPKFDEVDAPDE
jgi:hypothetical protein